MAAQPELNDDWPASWELEQWADQPLAALQEAEKRIYRRVLSLRRGQRDTPAFGTPKKRTTGDRQATLRAHVQRDEQARIQKETKHGVLD